MKQENLWPYSKYVEETISFLIDPWPSRFQCKLEFQIQVIHLHGWGRQFQVIISVEVLREKLGFVSTGCMSPPPKEKKWQAHCNFHTIKKKTIYVEWSFLNVVHFLVLLPKNERIRWRRAWRWLSDPERCSWNQLRVYWQVSKNSILNLWHSVIR